MIRKLLSLLHNEILIALTLVLIRLFVFFGIVFKLNEYFVAIYFILTALSFCMSTYIINKNDNPIYKLTWALLIMAVPVFGDLIHLLLGGQEVPKELRKRDSKALENYQEISWQNTEIMEALEVEDSPVHKQVNYSWKNAIFPIYNHTETTYFPVGEEKFKAMVEESEKAESFIFMEYLIIAPGVMWGIILDILIDKVKQGVKVRVIYDDAGCIIIPPQDYYLTLRRLGIQVKVFSPVKSRSAMRMNNRDHRKILVIDGKAGTTGGISPVDEHTSQKERFGHWKDCSVMIRGGTVWNLTLIFLQFWNYDEKGEGDVFSHKSDFKVPENIHNDGYVQPYSDFPTGEESVGEYIHINMTNSADRYAYATTPYLVIDNEMKTALLPAAKDGIDVRILVPHTPDKWYVFVVTCSDYENLIGGGVKIYEYTPGFVHGESFVVDDKMAIIGTADMDYRSYYLHYECGVWFYRGKVVMDVKRDYLETLSRSHQVILGECRRVRLSIRIMRATLNLLLPMM